MISLAIIFLTTIIYISENLIRANAYKNLKNSVVSAFDEIEVYDGELTIDNDFIIFNNNVHLSVYNDETGFIYGDIPLDFEYDETFSDKNNVRIIRHKNKKWYIFVHHYLLIVQQGPYFSHQRTLPAALGLESPHKPVGKGPCHIYFLKQRSLGDRPNWHFGTR